MSAGQMDVIVRRAPDWPPRGDRDHIFLNVILDDSIFLTKTNPAATIQARISLLGSSGLLTLWPPSGVRPRRSPALR